MMVVGGVGGGRRAAAAAKAATAAARAKAQQASGRGDADGAADGAAPPRDPASQGRGWVPSATRWEAEHPDGHSWRETDEEIEITFPLPAGASSTQDVEVEIGAGSIRICALGEELMAGETLGKLLVEESSWSYQPVRLICRVLSRACFVLRLRGCITLAASPSLHRPRCIALAASPSPLP